MKYSANAVLHTEALAIHSIALSSFASIMGPMGPFGGFFASDFERAFKIKVGISDTILPTRSRGFGGIMDRFDCQYLMATFVNVYIASFISYVLPVLSLVSQLSTRERCSS
ncbi:hypothetical protein KUCAC02_029164 [Chaenocephalus aceratus]|uniref:Uncharacterized protein n=1 Tax=Chaenocephalus aceratus TaxID=36190 RepID=A0ACB9X5L1_CHAAC|nr:hypothetical protein KUCAC02_029164 [Chaenocephalus aceratus]